MDSKEDDGRRSRVSDVGAVDGAVVDHHVDVDFPCQMSAAAPPGDVELGDKDEEEKRGEVEDDEARRPPEMMAALFEGEKAGVVKDGDPAPVPEQRIAASVEGHGDEEEKREEVEESPATVENGEGLVDPSYLSSRPIPTTNNDARGCWSRLPYECRDCVEYIMGFVFALGFTLPILILAIIPSPTTPSPTTPSEPEVVPSIWNQQGPAIFGDAVYDEFGTSVALSADAKTLVVGAPIYNWENTENMGYVKVYRADEDGGDRVQLGETIYGDALGDSFGYSVDVSPDGNTLVIGSPGSGWNEDQPGYVRVFSLESGDDLDTGSWKQIGEDIVGEANGDEFGYSVSLSEDGKTIAVGAPYNDWNGHVRVYRLDDSGSSWMQLGEDIDGEAAGDWSGLSVSLSADGKTVAIGATYAGIDDVWTGQVRVYRIDSEGSIWESLGQGIYGVYLDDCFGQSVKISPDSNTLAIGSPGSGWNEDQPGYVRVFSLESSDDLDTSSWKQIGHDIVGEANGDEFGYSVSLSEDGKTIAVGAPYYNDWIGYVRVYRLDDSGSSWMQLGEDIDGETAYDNSGVSVSLSADGKTVAIGANAYDAGQVRVFVMD